MTLFFRDRLSEQIALETDAQSLVTTRYLTDAYSMPKGKIDIGNSTGRSYYTTEPRGNVTQMIARGDQKVKAADWDADALEGVLGEYSFELFLERRSAYRRLRAETRNSGFEL